MTPKQIEDLETVTRIQIVLQVALQQLDELSHSTMYVKANKQRLENIYTYISKLVETLTDGFKPVQNPNKCKVIEKDNKLLKKEMDRYIKVVADIEKILTKVTVTV